MAGPSRRHGAKCRRAAGYTLNALCGPEQVGKLFERYPTICELARAFAVLNCHEQINRRYRQLLGGR